ncbi:MAG: radical SAM protein [PVC group bacterium]|nr:radical SAM protein [PVC group bacterium]
MKIVIANSIGVDKNGYYIIHSPSRWSEGVKSRHNWFAYYPWELAYLSALLKRETAHEVCFLDGCLEQLKADAYYERIIAQKPDFLVIESATRVIDENTELALKIKKSSGAKIIFTGPHASVFPKELLEKGIDYVCIGEYEYAVLELIQGKNKSEILGLYPNARRPLLDVNSLPWPEDNDVSRLRYSQPGEPSSEFLEVQMYGSRGCPMSCNFCVARNIYYDQPNWRSRDPQDIVKELRYLSEKYPAMQGVFFDEEVHNAKKEFILELSNAIVEAGLNNLHYEAMCDVRFLDEETLKAMKMAGYYKIRVGIETASIEVKQGINKSMDLDLVRQRLNLAKTIGIKTYGTFTFGALGSTMAEDNKTVILIKDLIKDKLLDNLQISICTPQPGTPFYDQVKAQKFLRNNLDFTDFDGGNFAVVSYPGYDFKMIERMKNKAFLMRDHCFFKSKICNFEFFSWVRSIYKRYGVIGLLSKGLRRLPAEVRYFLWK